MNIFQKTGVFLARLAGICMVIDAVVGFGYLVILGIHGDSPVPSAQLVASVFWIMIGFLIVLLAKPIGRFLGAGLD